MLNCTRTSRCLFSRISFKAQQKDYKLSRLLKLQLTLHKFTIPHHLLLSFSICFVYLPLYILIYIFFSVFRYSSFILATVFFILFFLSSFPYLLLLFVLCFFLGFYFFLHFYFFLGFYFFLHFYFFLYFSPSTRFILLSLSHTKLICQIFSLKKLIVCVFKCLHTLITFLP